LHEEKVKFTLEQAMEAQRGSRGMVPHFHWGGRSTPRPGRFILRKETWYPLYRRPGGPQGQSGSVRNILPPLGLDP